MHNPNFTDESLTGIKILLKQLSSAIWNPCTHSSLHFTHSSPWHWMEARRMPFSTHWMGGRTCHRADMDGVAKRKFPSPIRTRTPTYACSLLAYSLFTFTYGIYVNTYIDLHMSNMKLYHFHFTNLSHLLSWYWLQFEETYAYFV
jgi:hypothetical protein